MDSTGREASKGSTSFKRSSLRLHLKPYDVMSLTSGCTTRRLLPPTPSSPQRPLPSNNQNNQSKEPNSHSMKPNQEYPSIKRRFSQLKSIKNDLRSPRMKNKVIFADFINNMHNRKSHRPICSPIDLKNVEDKKNSVMFEIQDPLVFWTTTKETTA